jgi:3-oxoacyl-[acyl-carrier-protein] synthase-3
MIGIKAVAAYIPDSHADNLEQGRRFGESEEFIREKIGGTRLPRMPQGFDTSDLAVAALDRLLQQSPELDKKEIQALVVVTQNGDGHGLPHTSAIVQSKAALPNDIAAFDISLGCSGYVYGLAVVKGLMETAGLKHAVLITADPYSKIVEPEDRVTTLLFGDAATATWLGEDPGWDVETPLFGTDGSGAKHLMVDGKKLTMNGRQVFNFTCLKIPGQIKKYLQSNNLRAEDIDLYCLHQGSASIVTTLAKRFPEVEDRFICDMDETGNTVSSSIPLLLTKNMSRPELSTILISGFGVGLSWATTILKRRG